MGVGRRETDRCWIKRMWDRGTPYIHMGAFLVTILSIFAAGVLRWDHVEASVDKHENRLNEIEEKMQKSVILLERIDQRVSDMYDRNRRR